MPESRSSRASDQLRPSQRLDREIERSNRLRLRSATAQRRAAHVRDMATEVVRQARHHRASQLDVRSGRLVERMPRTG